MLQFFRNFFGSKLGIGVTMGFLVLIAIAFASADVSNTGSFGGVAGGDRVATVGKARIDAAELSQAATTALENIRQEQPTATMQTFLAAGGLDQVLESMLDRTAIGEFGRQHGIVASDRLVDSEIAKIAAFKGPDGRFSEEAFRQLLAQRGVSEALIRDDFAQGLVARQILVPAAFGAKVPQEFARRYAALLRERRAGAIGLLPSAAFAPAKGPTPAELKAYYDKRQDRYIRPERRVVRYAVFGDDILKTVPAPTDAEIAARYNANKAKYAASETRTFTQLIVPTEAAAKAILAEVAKGARLEAAASAKGLVTARLDSLGRDALAGQASAAVADAAFAAGQGSLAAPARSPLGWHVMRIDAVNRTGAKSLEQVRGELTAELAALKRRAAINDLSARLEDEFDNGATLGDAAKELGLTLATTEPLTANGEVYGKPGAVAPAVLGRALSAAFTMERENQPQLAEIEPGKVFMIFDVAAIEASAPAPLKEIESEVTAAWMLEKGAEAARAAADRVVAASRKGTPLAQAMAALGKPLPPVDEVAMGREDLARRQDGVPPPVVLLFSMAQGTVKMLKAPNDRGWYVVSLRQIVPGQLAPNDPLLASASRELAMASGRELAEAMRRAIRAEVGIERNPAAIAGVRKRLVGEN